MKDQVEFITVEEFMAKVGETKIELVESPKTNKLFVAGEKGNWKAEQKIDLDKEVRMLIPQEEGESQYELACMVNVKESNNVKKQWGA